MTVRAAVLGAGSFGSCLAILCADRGHDVSLWARDEKLIGAIAKDRRNPRFLKHVDMPEAIRPTTDLAEAVADCEMVIIAVPSHAVRDVVARAARSLPAEAILVS